MQEGAQGFIENFVRDIRLGLRMLRRNRGFTVLAILCLTLGIGANVQRSCALWETLFVSNITGATLSIGERAEVTTGSIVSANYFDAIGVRPILGRGFERGEDSGRNAHPLVVNQLPPLADPLLFVFLSSRRLFLPAKPRVHLHIRRSARASP
jgi:hypothetical protein